MRVIYLVLFSLLFSCQEKVNEVAAPVESKDKICFERPPFVFKQVVHKLDSTFLSFTNPMDSINNLIESKNIKPIIKAHAFDSLGYKKYWYDKGVIIKIETFTVFYDRPIYHHYYVQDKCHWYHKREEYHEETKDSLLKCDLTYYRDTTILNAFAGARRYECELFIVVDSNRFSIEEARKTRKRFADEIRWNS